METKTIPFDLETAKKIQAGEIEGRIMLKETEVKILYFDRKIADGSSQIIVLLPTEYGDKIEYFNQDGIEVYGKGLLLFIELPEEAPNHKFKPFDQVLVRDTDKDAWRPRLYSRKGRVGYCMQDNYEYMQILSYEGNEHLVGTTDKPKED